MERENIVRICMKKLFKYGLFRKIKWISYLIVIEIRLVFYEVGVSGVDVLKF